jgi:hypothetical protein
MSSPRPSGVAIRALIDVPIPGSKGRLSLVSGHSVAVPCAEVRPLERLLS